MIITLKEASERYISILIIYVLENVKCILNFLMSIHLIKYYYTFNVRYEKVIAQC
jgi:hypothetical protein